MNSNKYKLMWVLGLFCLFASCKKADGPDMNYYIDKPTALKVTVDKTTIKTSWEYPGNEQSSFVVQVSSAENFATILKTDTVSGDTRSLDFADMGYFSAAYVRIRALSKNIVLHSDFVTEALKPESILKELAKADIAVTTAILKWNAPSSGTLTNVIVIDNESKAETNIQLTSSNLTQQQVALSNLVSAKSYTAVIFAGAERKGVITFTTRDVRMSITINGDPTLYDSIQEAIDAANAGDVITIGGAKYDYGSAAIKIDKSITIRKMAGADMPEITSGNIDLLSTANITLQDIKFIGKSAYNIIATNLVGVANLVVERCEFTGPTAGFIYTAAGGTGATVGLIVRNSFFYRFGYTGGDFIDFRAGKLNKISFTNSTFHDLARDFMRIDNPVAYYDSNDPILFENCTFDRICNSGRFYYLRSPSVVVHFKKSIFSNKKTNTATGVQSGAKVLFTDNNFFGDFNTLWYGSATVTGSSTLDPQYAAFETLNFKIGNPALKALGYGDSRWLQ
ncbi:DUF4957 domain-containing protein [Pedobacter insulae]|uniref:DUF5123 domain-containing protein n=1 Tax=Pedobacter insulae TaxID=414048 RepID=A0A1I2YFH5_9SPHI|nr:DUF4957 domain-containing protein [Pedobacter insulae]SFH24335.1 protein of unknown function [Pedobacter insulae]